MLNLMLSGIATLLETKQAQAQERAQAKAHVWNPYSLYPYITEEGLHRQKCVAAPAARGALVRSRCSRWSRG
jgi:hypothetical protein